ncbi:hypothetical protein [uncultured Thomasclavelia sp.]|uniref:hypothetical protein n=1 Tax=uncultured Thomasclavelia sp. TaxID=3025759 RepID=UPI002636BB3C|nr:hypothetical protein [uncultured Thomasclavelia sp.]
MNIQEIESSLKALQKQVTVLEKAIKEFKENSKPKTIYDLRDGDKYWVVGYDGAINGCTFFDSYSDKKIIEIGSAFLTEEEAKYEIKCREVYTQLKKYSYDFSYEEWKNGNILKYFLNYIADQNYIKINSCYHLNCSALYFKTKENAQLAIDEVGKENIIKYYFKIRDYQ